MLIAPLLLFICLEKLVEEEGLPLNWVIVVEVLNVWDELPLGNGPPNNFLGVTLLTWW